MQYTLPIVSTKVGGIPDIVQDGCNGYVCDSGNSEQIAEKIALLIGNKCLRHEMGAEGKKMFLKSFSISSFERRLMEILDSCC